MEESLEEGLEEGLASQLQETKSRLDGKADLSQLTALREDLQAMVEQRLQAIEEELGRLRSEVKEVKEASIAKPSVAMELQPEEAVEEAANKSREYVLEKSSWDTLLICGLLTRPLETAMVLLGCLLNIGIQFAYCIIIWVHLATPVITRETLKDLAIWRMVIGHDIQHVDELMGTSLVERICNAAGYVIKGESQQKLNAQLGSYSSVLCIISLFFWVMVVLSDIATTVDFFRGIISLPFDKETRIGRSPDGSIAVGTIGIRRLALLLVGAVIPKLVVACLLGYLGVRYLIYVKSSADLLMNAIALSFVLSTDETLFSDIVPERVQGVLARVRPLTISERFRPPLRSLIPWRSLMLFTVSILLIMTFSVTWLATELDLSRRGLEIMCGGNRDFVYTVDKSLHMVNVADTRPSAPESLFETNSFRSVFQKTGLEPAKTLEELPSRSTEIITLNHSFDEVREMHLYGYGFHLAADTDSIYWNTSVDNVRATHLVVFQEAADQLPCRNLDIETLAHQQAFFDFTGVSRCDELMERGSRCEVSVRPFCPATCGCQTAQSSMYNRAGCSIQCDLGYMNSLLREEEDTLENHGCIDFNWGAVEFFEDVQRVLLQQEHLQVYQEQGPGFVWPSFESVYSLSIWSEPAYLLVDNMDLGKMARESQQRRAMLGNNQDDPGVCGLVTLVYRVFNIDLCYPQDDIRLGSIRSKCARTCGLCGSKSGWPYYETATLQSLVEWTKDTLKNQVLMPFGSMDDFCLYYWQFPAILSTFPPPQYDCARFAMRAEQHGQVEEKAWAG